MGVYIFDCIMKIFKAIFDLWKINVMDKIMAFDILIYISDLIGDFKNNVIQ